MRAVTLSVWGLLGEPRSYVEPSFLAVVKSRRSLLHPKISPAYGLSQDVRGGGLAYRHIITWWIEQAVIRACRFHKGSAINVR